MLKYFVKQKISIDDIINDIEQKYNKCNQNILKKNCNFVLKNKYHLYDYYSYFFIKQILFNEVKYFYDLECCLIKYKLPDNIINIIMCYLKINLL